MRRAVLIAGVLIGLSTVGAFASGVYRRRPTSVAATGSHALSGGASSIRLDNTLSGDSSAAGTYCPIPPRGQPDKGHATTAAPLAADSLVLGGQSVVPDTVAARCAGTAVPAKQP
jgi:hypothetical protein